MQPQCVKVFNEIKLGHKYRYIIYSITDDYREIMVHRTGPPCEYSEIAFDDMNAKVQTAEGSNVGWTVQPFVKNINERFLFQLVITTTLLKRWKSRKQWKSADTVSLTQNTTLEMGKKGRNSFSFFGKMWLHILCGCTLSLWDGKRAILGDAKIVQTEKDSVVMSGHVCHLFTIVFNSKCRSPECATIKQKMIYSSSKDALKKSLIGIGKEMQACDRGDLAWTNVLEKLLRSEV